MEDNEVRNEEDRTSKQAPVKFNLVNKQPSDS